MPESGTRLPGNAIDGQQEKGAEGGDHDTPEIERLDFPESDEGPEETAENRADDPDEDRNDDSTRVFAGHDELRERSRDQSEQDPRYDSHGFF